MSSRMPNQATVRVILIKSITICTSLNVLVYNTGGHVSRKRDHFANPVPVLHTVKIQNPAKFLIIFQSIFLATKVKSLPFN